MMVVMHLNVVHSPLRLFYSSRYCIVGIQRGYSTHNSSRDDEPLVLSADADCSTAAAAAAAAAAVL